jgi:hypothetical protein
MKNLVLKMPQATTARKTQRAANEPAGTICKPVHMLGMAAEIGNACNFEGRLPNELPAMRINTNAVFNIRRGDFMRFRKETWASRKELAELFGLSPKKIARICAPDKSPDDVLSITIEEFNVACSNWYQKHGQIKGATCKAIIDGVYRPR